MAKVKVTKTSVVVEIMVRNAHRPAEEVARIIETQLPCREGYGKVWYRWAVKEGVAPGAIRDPKAAKTTKAKVPSERQLNKRLKVEKAIAKAKFSAKSVDEIAKIKEANLARMKEVSAKLKTKKVRDFGDRVAKDDGEGVADFDPRLAREEIDSILRDERLIDVCPKFVREDA